MYPLSAPHDPTQPIIEAINKDIQKRHQEATTNFSQFVSKKYAEMDYKINRCTYNCYRNAEEYQQMRDCKQMCSGGQKKFPSFVEKTSSDMNNLLNECLNRSRDVATNDVFQCYDAYIRGFKVLMMKIEEESRYYQ